MITLIIAQFSEYPRSSHANDTKIRNIPSQVSPATTEYS
ncbi:MAG: hypothetical protein ACD_28C00215G0001 [uncultured bacterium]|nr:MAG: hypothetical protein ACD_28C00215G0001 [uncultured bacterium]